MVVIASLSGSTTSNNFGYSVAIARALVGAPALILADEPTGNLDSKSGDEIIKLLLDLNKKGNTLVLVTHELEIARKAKRVIKMMDGKIVSDTKT